MPSKLCLASRFLNQPPSIWVEVNKLVAKTKSLNLGQGFPDYAAPPSHCMQSLKDVATEETTGLHQYARAFGHVRLVEALANLYSPIFSRSLDPLNEILISVGAYGSLFTVINAFIEPGDEVIIIEPYFDCYEPMVLAAQGKPIYVPLRPPSSGAHSSADWHLDMDELKKKFNKKTKAFIFNTPNNPMGKMFTRNELDEIAQLCVEHDVLCISDEVYEWITFDGNKHIKIATLPNMWDRTLTIGSAGKTFSVTGWKLGWTIGPNHLMKPLQTVHANCIYTCPTPLQEAVARSLEIEIPLMNTEQSYFHKLSCELQEKRDHIAASLQEAGLTPTVPEGGYFLLADISHINLPEGFHTDTSVGGVTHKDILVNEWMARNKKLVAIPPSVFYNKEHKQLGENYIRFCFIKKRETIEQASVILNQWKNEQSAGH